MTSGELNDLIFGLIQLLCFVPAIVIHEVSHGFVAHRLGDPTAKSAGRLSLNPLKHIDPFGTVILPILLAVAGGPVFGYAKPVPYNPRYFKNLKMGEVMTGLAGPASNLVMALVTTVIFHIVIGFIAGTSEVSYWVLTALQMFIYINLILMFFNLIPIPPLDGSSVVMLFLPRKAIPTWYQIQRYALPVFFIVVFVLPYVLNFNPLGLYLQVTAGNLFALLMSF